MTPDQVRRMEQYEALVFLQEGVITKTRLFPFPPRDPATGEWILLHGSRREQALYSPLRQKLETLAFDRRMARPRLILLWSAAASGDDGMPPAWPIHRLRQRDLNLDRTLGPLMPSSTPPLPLAPSGPAAQPVDASQTSVASEGPNVAHPAEEAQQAPSIDVPGEDLASPPDSGPSPLSAPQPTQVDETSSSGTGKADISIPAPAVQGPDTNALGEMTGFFRSITQRKITVPEYEHGGAPAGWRIMLPEGPFVLVRHSFALACGQLRRTKPQDILDRWRSAGLIAASRVNVTVEKPPAQVLVFTPLAVSRFIPAIRDEI